MTRRLPTQPARTLSRAKPKSKEQRSRIRVVVAVVGVLGVATVLWVRGRPPSSADPRATSVAAAHRAPSVLRRDILSVQENNRRAEERLSNPNHGRQSFDALPPLPESPKGSSRTDTFVSFMADNGALPRGRVLEGADLSAGKDKCRVEAGTIVHVFARRAEFYIVELGTPCAAGNGTYLREGYLPSGVLKLFAESRR